MADYFRFVPQGIGAGKAWTPLMGESEVGRIYAVEDSEKASILSANPDWQASNQQAYDAQKEG